MPKIPEPTDSTTKRIYASYESRQKSRHSRRLGASIIGDSCERKLWYSFRWCKKPDFEGRTYRIFAKGNLEEAMVIEDLRAIGVEIMPLDPDTGKQWEFSTLGDHFVVKPYGVLNGLVEAPATWHALEIKSCNQAAYDKLVKDGLEKANPKHWAQVITEMGMAELDRAVYIAVNKNTDEIYFERIPINKKAWKDILNKAKSIIFSSEPPDRNGTGPAYWECKFCDYHAICHNIHGVAEINCRTCIHSSPLEEGGWACDETKGILSDDLQKVGCDMHHHRPGMISDNIEVARDMFGAKVRLDENNLSV